jgi:hypothetical protein
VAGHRVGGGRQERPECGRAVEVEQYELAAVARQLSVEASMIARVLTVKSTID